MRAESNEPPHNITADAPVIVIGAGPAGLTAAYELARRNVPVTVVDQDTVVGGLAQTVSYKGFRFDIGGHRFFTRVQAVRSLWRRMLGPDLLRRPRLSRILYRGRFFQYPLKPLNALVNLGPWATLLVVASYLKAKLHPIRPERTFADWVTNRFGRRLFLVFFKSYTEKVWGISCDAISAAWAAQRIKGLSLRTTLSAMVWPHRYRRRDRVPTTLISAFEYPRLGPGMMWERFATHVTNLGGQVMLESRVVRVAHDGRLVTAVHIAHRGQARSLVASHLVSSMPLPDLVRALDPPPPRDVLDAAARLKHRDFLTVALVVNQPHVFADNWIYVHDEHVRLGRIQNYKNWSADMVPDARQTCLGLEYFVNEGDDLWSMNDADLVALGEREIVSLGLVPAGTVVDGTVVRMPKAYPVYDDGYQDAVMAIRRYLDRFTNLQPVGRNGMHKYNNQDHSMLTAMLAVRNLCGASHDLWSVNTSHSYHELDDASAAPSDWDVTERAAGSTEPFPPPSRVAPAID